MKSDFTFIYSAPKVTDEKLPAVFYFTAIEVMKKIYFHLLQI